MPVKPYIMCPWILEREIQLDNNPTAVKALPWVAAIPLLFSSFASCNRNNFDILIGPSRPPHSSARLYFLQLF